MRISQFSQATRIFTFIFIAVLVFSGIGLSLNLPVSACTNDDCGRWLNNSGEMSSVLEDTAGIVKQAYPAEGEKQDYRQTATADYFNQQTAGHLTADEWKDFHALQEFMNLPAVMFTGYAQPALMWKYGLAFTAYGLASIPYIEPGQRVAIGHYIDKLIQKMKLKVVWVDWVEQGYGDDYLSEHNIMYKGHLNLMYGLHGLIYGGNKWDKDFTWLTDKISNEIDETSYSGVTCEPDDYYVQCNTIGIYSLLLYDKLHGTDHSKQVNSWLKFVKTRMIVEPYGLFSRCYHPEHDYVEDGVSGNCNAWSITFIHAIDPAFAEELYPKFKKTFVKETGQMAYATEYPNGNVDPLVTILTLALAKEMGDQALFDKILNMMEKYNTPSFNGLRSGRALFSSARSISAWVNC
ncbi:MAG: hypothetical protein NTZ34_08795 [Chloroflexi bacterium]|nr:hypothetical protein [Chloroflexota bacterium]